MNIVSFMVKKYLHFDKSQPFISVAAILAFLGVCIGVFVLIVAMAIMNGFDKEFEKKLFTMNYPITVVPRTASYLNESTLVQLQAKFPQMKFSPFIRASAIVKNKDSMEGALVFGVNFKKEAEINDVFAKSLSAEAMSNSFIFDAVVGKRLMEENDLSVGSKVLLMFGESEPQGFGVSPVMKRFQLVSSFSSGLAAYDKAYIYVNAEGLRKVLGYPDASFDGVHIYSKEPMSDIKPIKAYLGDSYAAVGWWEQNGNFFSALQLEKKALFLVLMLIILIASLNIVSSLLMTVMSRRKEIALLLSLGASVAEVRKIFFYLGITIGGAGIVFGAFFGLFAVYLLGTFDIVTLPADVYPSSKLPLDLSLVDFISIMFGAAAIVLFSSYYPAKKASEIDVLSVLRHE